ncbi:MAG: hypothetical protein JW786_04350 [Desulfobacterales bacterium]|nr:hypothetical protein [Desulfobacterales bacterium]
MSIQPEGEDLRKAVKWISEQRQSDSTKNLEKLVNEASLMFNLSPKDEAFLSRFFQEK